MDELQERPLELVSAAASALVAGAAAMVLHGLLRWLSGGQSITECVTSRAWCLAVTVGCFTWLLLNEAGTLPWHWLGKLLLLVATAPALLAWLGPPAEHVEASNISQIGKGSAYSHFFGYLRLMHHENGIRKRLETFKMTNPFGLSETQLQNFYSSAVVALAPTDGQYPSDSFSDLRGVDSMVCEMDKFKVTVGGNERTYGNFGIYEVTSSNSDNKRKRYVALDRVGALATLGKLRQHCPASFSEEDCITQMKDMLDELEKIVAKNAHLKDQLKVVKYVPYKDHVGDAILAAIE